MRPAQAIPTISLAQPSALLRRTQRPSVQIEVADVSDKGSNPLYWDIATVLDDALANGDATAINKFSASTARVPYDTRSTIFSLGRMNTTQALEAVRLGYSDETSEDLYSDDAKDKIMLSVIPGVVYAVDVLTGSDASATLPVEITLTVEDAKAHLDLSAGCNIHVRRKISTFTLKVVEGNKEQAQECLKYFRSQAKLLRERLSKNLGQIAVYENYYDSHCFKSSWRQRRFAFCAPLDCIALEDCKMKQLKSFLTAFCSAKYIKRQLACGEPLQTSLVLHGPPGTGKSKTICALATEFFPRLYYLDLSLVKGNDDLAMLINGVQDPCIVAIEDFDEQLRALADQTPKAGQSNITLVALLNTLSGVLAYGSDRRVYMLTCNNLDSIPVKMQRARRFELVLEFGMLSASTLQKLCSIYLNDEKAAPLSVAANKVLKCLEKVDVSPAQAVAQWRLNGLFESGKELVDVEHGILLVGQYLQNSGMDNQGLLSTIDFDKMLKLN